MVTVHSDLREGKLLSNSDVYEETQESSLLYRYKLSINRKWIFYDASNNQYGFRI
jgi:hypothetical protein